MSPKICTESQHAEALQETHRSGLQRWTEVALNQLNASHENSYIEQSERMRKTDKICIFCSLKSEILSCPQPGPLVLQINAV